jgi:hypothetical protein
MKKLLQRHLTALETGQPTFNENAFIKDLKIEFI